MQTPLLILFAGLITFVPVDEDTAVMLLPDAAAEYRVGETVVPAHAARIRLRTADGVITRGLAGQHLEFGSEGSQTRDMKPMFDFNELLEGAGWTSATVPTDCATEEACAGITASIRIHGGSVRVGDLEIDTEAFGGLKFVLGFERELFGFVHPGKTTLATSYTERGASAVRYGTKVSEPLELALGSETFRLVKQPSCSEVGVDGECYLIQVENVPPDFFTEVEQDELPKVGDVDPHFAHHFRVLEQCSQGCGDDKLMIPVVLGLMEKSNLPEKPSVRCPNVFVDPK